MIQPKSDLELKLADEIRRAIKGRQRELELTTAELSRMSTITENTLRAYFDERMDMSSGKIMLVLKALKIKVRLVRAGKVKR